MAVFLAGFKNLTCSQYVVNMSIHKDKTKQAKQHENVKFVGHFHVGCLGQALRVRLAAAEVCSLLARVSGVVEVLAVFV